MSEGEKVKKMLEFREKLERKIDETQQELENLKTLMEIIDSLLLEKGFKRAEIPKSEAPTEKTEKTESLAKHVEEYPVKTVTGEQLAVIHIGDNFVRVVMDKNKEFRDNIPPFKQFLVERVLLKMQEKDREAARRNEITPDKILSYSIIKEGDIIREIVIRNVNEERVRDLKSGIRWTLEKMYEKMAANP